MREKIFPALTLVINYYSAVYVITGAAIPYFLNLSIAYTFLFIFTWLYLVPPLLCRLFISIFGRPVGTVDLHSKTFLYWWFLTQLQIIFVRLQVLEELLRLFPGLYSLWLNLWGAKVSVLTYWSPGVTVTDYYHISIGRGVVVGGGCRIGGHVFTLDKDGGQRLILAPLLIEHDSLIGLNAAVGPGSHVHANETIPAGKMLKPFYSWKDGKVHRPVANS